MYERFRWKLNTLLETLPTLKGNIFLINSGKWKQYWQMWQVNRIEFSVNRGQQELSDTDTQFDLFLYPLGTEQITSIRLYFVSWMVFVTEMTLIWHTMYKTFSYKHEKSKKAKIVRHMILKGIKVIEAFTHRKHFSWNKKAIT